MFDIWHMRVPNTFTYFLCFSLLVLCMCVRACVYAYICACVFAYVCMCACVHVCMYMYVYVYMYVYMYAHVYACMCLCMFMYFYCFYVYFYVSLLKCVGNSISRVNFSVNRIRPFWKPLGGKLRIRTAKSRKTRQFSDGWRAQKLYFPKQPNYRDLGVCFLLRATLLCSRRLYSPSHSLVCAGPCNIRHRASRVRRS